MKFLQDTAVLVPLVIGSIYGAVKLSATNFYPSIDNTLNQNMIYGIIVMIHAMFGIKPISELPSRTQSVTSNTWFKLLTLIIISFSATRDFEDAIFVLIAFLGIVQLMRTKEERSKYPYIIA
jgi:hypothetical protein